MQNEYGMTVEELTSTCINCGEVCTDYGPATIPLLGPESFDIHYNGKFGCYWPNTKTVGGRLLSAKGS